MPDATKAPGLTTEVTTSYIPGDDITIIWQDMFLNGEHVQRSLIGWHYGETSEVEIKEYGNMPLTAQFFFN